MIVWSLIIVGCVVLDQLTKWLIVAFLNPQKPFVIWEGVFRFSYVENTGAAFGSFSDHRWVFMIISTVAIVGLLVYLWRFTPDSKLACTAIAMIAGGGIGNMIDRVFHGYVIDFIDFYLFPEIWPWVFNVADSFVCVGGALLFLWCVLSIIDESKAKKQAAGTETTATKGEEHQEK